jgi:hypothetical protein
MLRSTKELQGVRLAARDGEVGRCQAFLFDDEYWMVQRMVVRLRRNLFQREVLISPVCIQKLPDAADRIPVHLTRADVEDAPPLSTKVRPPEAQLSEEHMASSNGRLWRIAPEAPACLHATDHVVGWGVETVTGIVGEVRDFVIDDHNWMICYVVARCGKWPKRRDVLIATSWISGIVGSSRRLKTNMPDQMLTGGTPFARDILNHSYNVNLYDFYGRPAHWVANPVEQVRQ